MGVKGWTYIIFGALFLSIVGVSLIQSNRIKELQTELSYSKANEKSLFDERDSLKYESRTLYLTVEQLNYVNDSIVRKMNSLRRELNIKDKDIQELQYQLSEASKVDTVIFRDTLFRDPSLQLDTLLGNRWYNIGLSLSYPSTIVVSPSFTSERYTNMYLKKETINPPKRCKFLQLFQRKHKIMVVEIKEENPYIDIKEQKFIKIIE